MEWCPLPQRFEHGDNFVNSLHSCLCTRFGVNHRRSQQVFRRRKNPQKRSFSGAYRRSLAVSLPKRAFPILVVVSHTFGQKQLIRDKKNGGRKHTIRRHHAANFCRLQENRNLQTICGIMDAHETLKTQKYLWRKIGRYVKTLRPTNSGIMNSLQ